MIPKSLPCGYYVCRLGGHRQVARWMPDANCWLILGLHAGRVPPNYFDEIGERVA